MIARTTLLSISLLGLLAPGCYTTKMYYASQTPSAATRTATTHTFVLGLISTNPVNIEGLCGGAAVSEIRTRMSVGGAAATWLTLGLWTPMTVTATCSARD